MNSEVLFTELKKEVKVYLKAHFDLLKLETDEARAEGRPINNVISEGLQHYVWSPEIEKCLNEFLNGKVIPLVSQSRDAVLHAVAEVMARKDLNH